MSVEADRNPFTAFLTRCIGHGWAQRIDAEHGLRIHNVATFDDGRLRIELEGGGAIDIALTHSVSRTPKTDRTRETRNGLPPARPASRA